LWGDFPLLGTEVCNKDRMPPSKQISFLIGTLRKAWNRAIVDRFDLKSNNNYPLFFLVFSLPFFKPKISYRSIFIFQSFCNKFVLLLKSRKNFLILNKWSASVYCYER
jgi:hypothetical protein